MSEKEIWTILITSAVTIIGFVINYHYTKKEIKENKIYDLKFNAIQKSLKVLDIYISWLEISGIQSEQIVCEKTTKEELTILARECYNQLAITCNNIDIINKFMDIIVEPKDNIFLEYNQYRNLCREELGIIEELPLDNDRVFFSQVSTHNLENIT